MPVSLDSRGRVITPGAPLIQPTAPSLIRPSSIDTFALAQALKAEPQKLLPGMLGNRDWAGYLNQIQSLKNRGVQVDRLDKIKGLPVHCVRLPASVQPPKLKVMITGGVHGNESSGPAAALMIINHLLSHPELRKHVEVTVMPMVCPWGYINAKRNNEDNLNTNREYREGDDVPPEVKVSRAEMKATPVELEIDLHRSKSGGGKGFFLLQRESDAVAGPAMDKFRRRYPVLGQTTNLYEMFSPGVFKSRNTGTVKDYMASLGTKWSYTLEAPTNADYVQQVLGSAELSLALIEQALGQKMAKKTRNLI